MASAVSNLYTSNHFADYQINFVIPVSELTLFDSYDNTDALNVFQNWTRTLLKGFQPAL